MMIDAATIGAVVLHHVSGPLAVVGILALALVILIDEHEPDDA